MARPVDANPDETRRRIIDAAIPLFAEHGYYGVSTRALAARAKVNVATLSHYFGAKLGLFNATVDEVYRRLGKRVQEALIGASVGISPAQLEDFLGRIYDAARREQDGIRLLVRQVLDGGRLSEHTESKHFLPGLKQAAELGAAAFGCTPGQARAAAVTLSYLISRYVVQDVPSLQGAFGVRTPRGARAMVVATLVTTARALLSPDAPPAEPRNPRLQHGGPR